MALRPFSYEADGAQYVPGGATEAIEPLERAFERLPLDRAGLRLQDIPMLSGLLGADGPIGLIAAKMLGEKARPVRAILFDKNEAANWALGWHQDRTIAVAKRIEVSGFRAWTIKQGILHVEPPFEILADMMTLRVHLDPVPATNGPLLIAPGSHLHGRIEEADIADIVAQCGTSACEANAGDIWLYATPILHASEAAAHPARRRVLQIDYAAADLPGGLQWRDL